MRADYPGGTSAVRQGFFLVAILALAISTPIASAQDKHAHDKPAASAGKDMHMNQMQERMKAMQAQMETIRIVTDPAVKQRLMQEHMQAMQENMKAMRGMGGGMMMGGKKDGMKDGDMMKHHAMMEQRMDMMQMMMEQMMQRDQLMQSMPAK